LQQEIELAVIIVNYNSNEVLENCLQSIFKAELPFKYEILIIDNASEKSPDYIINKYPDVLLIENDKNVGFAAANNIGISKSEGKYILLLNPDTIINENSLLPMINYLDGHKDVGIVGCKIFLLNGEIERSTHSFPTLLKEFVHANEFIKQIFGYGTFLGKALARLFNFKSLESYWPHDSIREVDHVTGACMMVKREAINKVGLLDEAFFLYNEEVEWSYRMKLAGLKSVYLPKPNIIHLFGHSTGQKVQKQVVNKLLLERYRGMFYFFQKHSSKTKLFLFKLIVFEGFSLRLIVSYFKSFFTSRAKRFVYASERQYIQEIIKLIRLNEYDWRRN